MYPGCQQGTVQNDIESVHMVWVRLVYWSTETALTSYHYVSCLMTIFTPFIDFMYPNNEGLNSSRIMQQVIQVTQNWFEEQSSNGVATRFARHDPNQVFIGCSKENYLHTR